MSLLHLLLPEEQVCNNRNVDALEISNILAGRSCTDPNPEAYFCGHRHLVVIDNGSSSVR
jgi:hypothetical protein